MHTCYLLFIFLKGENNWVKTVYQIYIYHVRKLYFRTSLVYLEHLLLNDTFLTPWFFHTIGRPIYFWTLIIALLQPNPNLRYEKMLLSKIDSTNTLGRPTDESQYQGLGRTLEATSTSQKPHNEKVISRLFSKRRHLPRGTMWPKI